MQHIVFEVHAYVIALSKTVLDYEKLQGNAWLILPHTKQWGDAVWKGQK